MDRERITQFKEKPNNSFPNHWKAEKEKKSVWESKLVFLLSDPNGTSKVLENSGFSGIKNVARGVSTIMQD